jgi:hypothetical protein
LGVFAGSFFSAFLEFMPLAMVLGV